MPAFDEIMDELLHKSKFLENLFQNNVILECAEFARKKDYGFLWSIKNEIGPIMAYLVLTERKNLNDIKRWIRYAEIFSANYIKMAKTIEAINTIIKNLSLEEYCTFIKIRPYPRNHSDVDLLTSTPNKLMNAFKNLGFNIISENRIVIITKKDFLPIELHSKLSWESLEPINSANIISNATRRIIPQFLKVGDILLPSYVDDFLITIIHKIFQEGAITIGDLIHLYYDIVNDINCKKFKQEDFIKDLPWGFLIRYYTLIAEKLFLNKSSSDFSPAAFPAEDYQFFPPLYFKIIKKYGKNSIKWLLKNIIWILLKKIQVLQPSYY